MKTPKSQRVPIKISGVPFSKLSKADQRVAIAKDAIAQIKAEKYYIQSGTWADVKVEIPDQDDNPVIDQNVLLHGLPPVAPQISCTCCAIGAVFLSSIRLANKAVIKNQHLNGMEEASRQLRHFFSQDQLGMIETAFECGGGACHSGDGAEEFGVQYVKDQDRALAIFTNIVKNKGEFKP